MANKTLFASATRQAPRANTFNEAGAVAYRLSDKHALAQYAATGCFGTTYYASEGELLDRVLELCAGIEDRFIAQTAIYTREQGLMKDMPALLLAVLAARGSDDLEPTFKRVCDNGKMLRNFVQIVRSGVTGRRSLGTRPKRLIQAWLAQRSAEALLAAGVGNSPSLADIIKMVHPTPASPERKALYGYLIGRPYDSDALPSIVRDYESYKAAPRGEPPRVPFQMLTALELDTPAWKHIAASAGWQMTRMNLNTFARHGVFNDETMTQRIAQRLASVEHIRRAKVFPYQLLVAYSQAGPNIPSRVREALQTAFEVAISNVPRIEGTAYILPDISGSMHSPVTGSRKGSTSIVRCIDVAALVAAAFQRNNPDTVLLPFHDTAKPFQLDPQDRVMTNAQKLASLPSGGTDCSAPLRWLNRRKARGNLVVFVSDNQSWVDCTRSWNSGTAVMHQWEIYRSRNPQAKMVCIDIQPYANTQALERADILNIGGFSDAVFRMIDTFVHGRLDTSHWVDQIQRVTLSS